MPERAVLVVLAVANPGLRSALTAQLTLAGADIVTVSDPDARAVRGAVRRPAALVIDAQMLAAGEPGWLAALVREPHWYCVLALDVEPLPEVEGHLCYASAAEARAVIAQMLPSWRDDGSGCC
ncbi:hypothetical protein [Sphingomonas sp.]|uniref:hypothetical protein n=1 Tax=Sphingomonas sp. TaxID=28214 RepID=UPI001B197D72|nr:hypothetical protein [Sphingomonas sp.]MBO9714907.1 hypothetical protein [Sphingomonas sp.]